LLRAQGKPAEAEAAARRALTIRERLVADFPAVPEYRRDLADTYGGLGSLLRDVGKQAEAEAAYRQALTVRERLAADYPAVPDYRLGLANDQVNLGNLLLAAGQSSTALEWFDRGIDNVQAASAKDLRKDLARQTLQKAYWGRANVRNALGRHAEAVSDWDRAIDFATGPQRAMMRVQRALSLARAGDAERATAAADELARTPAEQGGSVYDAARIFSVLSGTLAGAEQKEPHARRAIELLTQARDQGFFQEPAKRDLLQKDHDLDPLRSREGFQKLLTPSSARIPGGLNRPLRGEAIRVISAAFDRPSRDRTCLTARTRRVGPAKSPGYCS
jgi:tetratricopeptide (TPR) repeat protein